MKKILSILVMVLCGVSNLWAAATVTINPTCSPADGGSVKVETAEARSGNLMGWSWYSYTNTPTAEVSSFSNWAVITTYTSQGGIKYRLTATPSEGYYFIEWDNLPSATLESGDYKNQQILNNITKNPVEYITKYVSTNTTYNVDAIFKHYVYGYGNGRSAEVSEGADYGEISLDNTNWSNVVSETASGAAIPKKQAGDGAANTDEEYITLTYYAKFKGDNTNENCYFLGWFDAAGNRLSTDFTYNHKFYPTSQNSAAPSQVPTIYAKFGKKALYKNWATAQVVLQDVDGSYIVVSEPSILETIGGVYVNSSSEVTPGETDYLVNYTFGDQSIKYIAENSPTGGYTYTYHALQKEGYKFVGWATELPEAEGKFTIKTESNPYTHEHFTAVVDETNAPTPTTLYAVFSQNTFYFYTGAIAGFTSNGEKGKIIVTSKYFNQADEDEELKDYEDATQDADINDSEHTYNTALNSQNYTYTYKAEKTDDKTAFKGWSRSLLGGNIVSEKLEYTETYTTLATTPEGANATPALYAVFQSFWYTDPTVLLTTSSSNAGKVAALEDNSTPETEDWKDEIIPSSTLHQVAAESNSHSYSIYYHAQPEFGANFVGWAKADDPNQIVADYNKNPYKVDYTVTSTDDTAPFAPAKIYAVFESVIKVIQKDRMIYYVDEHGNDNINNANVLINFNVFDELNAELIGEDRNLFILSDKANVEQGSSLTLDASTGLAHLVVKYQGNTPANHVGKKATIRLSSQYTDDNKVSGTASVDVSIAIETMPTVTFLPTDGKGAYTIKHTDGRSVGYEMGKEDIENIYVPISMENMSTFELQLTEDKEGDGLTFAGWEMIDGNNVSYFSYDKLCTYQFKQSVSVRPVFLADNRAVFTIIDDQYDNKYYDLQVALNDAKAYYDEDPHKKHQIVVFSNEGNPTGVLHHGDYTIPQGVMLLIPGMGPNDGITALDPAEEDQYIYRELTRGKYSPVINEDADIVLGMNDYISDANLIDKAKEAKCYRKLIVEDNTTITIQSGASLELYAVLNRYKQTYEARPYRYGQIELGENCRINVQDGGTLYAFGYITGAHSSRVIANSGAKVHEVFQYSDPRGGTAVAHLFLWRSQYKVFPFSQYYVQNVEIPLELKSGAVEYITTTADVLAPFVVMTSFIIPNDYDQNTSGLFRMGDNTSLVKYYDPIADRQVYKLIGDGAKGYAKFGFIDIYLGNLQPVVADLINDKVGIGGGLLSGMLSDLKTTRLYSRDYVLPLNHNMDIFAENANVDIAGEFAFLAGSTFSIDEFSSVNLSSAKIYLYDADQNRLPQAIGYGDGNGFVSNENACLSPIVATPNNTHKNGNVNKRLPENIKDAKWIVNGKVTIKSGAGLYTTASGAQITSTKNGQVQFETNLANAKTYQAKYKSGNEVGIISEDGIHEKVEYAVTSAKLQNADNSYVTTAQNTYTYDLAQGKWITSGAPTKQSNTDIMVTMPDYDLETSDVIDPYKFEVVSALFDVTGVATSSNVSAGTPNTDGDGVHIPLSYQPTNKAGEYEAMLTLNVNQYYQKIRIIEDYTPKFTLNGSYTFSACLGYTQELPAYIIPETQNVAGILSGVYAPEWKVEFIGENADEFTFNWGTGNDKLSAATIVFRPKTVGVKSAILSLTCTYTDGANAKHTTTIAVPITASAISLQNNTLAFAAGVDSIYGSDEALQLFAYATGNGQPISIELSDNDVVTIAGESAGTYDATIATITPLSDAVGKQVTITAYQPADLEDGIADAKITTTVIITDEFVWNWEHLYFGSDNDNPITTKYQDWTLAVAETVEIEGEVIEGDPHGVIESFGEVESGEPGDYKVSILGWETGETRVWFELTYVDGEEEKHKYFSSQVYRNPQHLPLNINEGRIYEAVTWSRNDVEYNETSATDIEFTSTNSQIAKWTFTFIGIPDLLSFTAVGGNNWQIEESVDGTNWSITYTWAPITQGIPFELPLQPSTKYVRISYANGNDPEGVLSNVTVSELTTVRSDVNKLYMPIESDGNGNYKSVTKNVVFTYVSEEGLDLKTSYSAFTTDPIQQLDGLSTSPYYVVKRVPVTSTATAELLGELDVNTKKTPITTEATIPIQAYNFPQAIPVQLTSDHQERYYYLLAESYKTTWDADTRKVVMQNAVADADPYVVFHFADVPTAGLISFNYSASAKGKWVIEERTEEGVWIELTSNVAENLNGKFVMRDFVHPEKSDQKYSTYVRIKYVSDYAEVVELSNLSILPTANATVDKSELIVYDTQIEKLSITTNNLRQVTFDITEDFQIVDTDQNVLDADALSNLFVNGTQVHDIYIQYTNTKKAAVTYGKLEIKTNKDAMGVDIAPKVLATVNLIGLMKELPIGSTKIYTGTQLTIRGFDKDKEAKHREVNTQYAFADNKPLFDYVIIYGETTTTDEASVITQPSSTAGSNAKTPCYIYKKNDAGTAYEISTEYLVENANNSAKSWVGQKGDKGAIKTLNGSLKVYITGFCPYASTGYSKSDEGVWYFRGNDNDNIDIYLEDCYLYSRYKSRRGNSFSRSSGEAFSDKVVRGSGAVLVVSNDTQNSSSEMNVTIHTRRSNLLKSHYGCMYEHIVGRAFQISSPVHVYMQSVDHYMNSKTILNFTDEWPTTVDHSTFERTNGFLSLQKQVNNAPSIDMGNEKTIVNFRGGQVELQNACNSSDNYQSTMAISYRTGVYGPASFNFVLAYGIGTDGVGGEVNFYDGTTTVLKMKVPERYRQYYLMDDDDPTSTSCLRTPKNTYVYGGSHCMMRACSAPTSKGGAPTNGSKPLGLYKYPSAPYTTGEGDNAVTHKGGWTANGSNGLVTPKSAPDGYNVESVTPNTNGTQTLDDDYLNFWVTEDYDDSVKPEEDQKISFWKACMTSIGAKQGMYEGSIGGMTTFANDGEKQTELVYNFLYCQIDERISDVINDGNYMAPVLNPAPVEDIEDKYLSIRPEVGPELQNYITNEKDYKVESKVYYIVPAVADVWLNFTAPFDVDSIYVMETYDEAVLSAGVNSVEKRDEQLVLQATHNANFAAFYGVALALESQKTFWQIYNDYMGWARYLDRHTGSAASYTKRGRYPLTHYYKTYDEAGKLTFTNWDKADYVLYKNTGAWEYDESAYDGEGGFVAKWDFVIPTEGEPLMKQGQTYSLQFPYCTGCWTEDGSRDFWDYWTGKFLIFVSTDGGEKGHTLKGSNFVGASYDGENWTYSEPSFLEQDIDHNTAVLLGNPTFAMMGTKNPNVYMYTARPNAEAWDINQYWNEDTEEYQVHDEWQPVEPTSALLLTTVVSLLGEPAQKITNDGRLFYRKGGNNGNGDGGVTTGGGNVPTVGGGNDLFITAISGGINVAVAAPQQVRVISSTGAVLYNGWVSTSVDVALPIDGIYIVSGENEVQKILY